MNLQSVVVPVAQERPTAPSGEARVSAAGCPAGLSHAPWWLPGGHAQTIWPALWSRAHDGPPPVYRRERWDTPDGDFVDADWLDSGALPSSPLLVLFHGLEGSSGSTYSLAFAAWARARGWAFVVPHFRGCSGSNNLAPRAYHSGDHEEIGWMLGQAVQRSARPAVAVGVSLGGNALLRWAQENGRQAGRVVRALASVCAPLDLRAGGLAIERGFGRLAYTPMFLRSMKPKALAKLAQFPGLFDAQALRSARTLYEFDDIFTAPLHGFRSTDDYWRRASARPRLRDVHVPALLLNPLNDPFVPAGSLPAHQDIGPCMTLWQPPVGGHVGFAGGAFPGHLQALPAAVMSWLESQL